MWENFLCSILCYAILFYTILTHVFLFLIQDSVPRRTIERALLVAPSAAVITGSPFTSTCTVGECAVKNEQFTSYSPGATATTLCPSFCQRKLSGPVLMHCTFHGIKFPGPGRPLFHIHRPLEYRVQSTEYRVQSTAMARIGIGIGVGIGICESVTHLK